MELMEEGTPSNGRTKAALATAGVGSLALGAMELKTGLSSDTLGLVADAWHNFGDGPIYLLRGLALHTEGHKASNRMRKLAAGIMLAGSAITAYETVEVALDTAPSEYLHANSETPLLPLTVAMAGNLAITGLVLAERKSQHAITAEAKQHAILDSKHSLLRLGAAASRIPLFDIAAAAYYGVRESARLGMRMLRSSHSHQH